MRALAFRLRPRLRLPKLGIALQVVIVLLVVGLAGAMAVEPTRQLLEQRDRIQTMTTQLHELERSNRRLERRITKLNDPDFIEQQARAQIGLVRPGEVAFHVLPPSGRKASRARKALVPAPPEPPTFVESLVAFIGL